MKRKFEIVERTLSKRIKDKALQVNFTGKNDAESGYFTGATAIKDEDITTSPKNGPKNWDFVYHLIKEYRKENKAEVDTMGCATLADHGDPKPLFRYHILTSLQLSSQTKDPITAQAIQNLKNPSGGLHPQTIKNMDDQELDSLISKVGFHNRKTKYLKQTAEILIRDYDGDIPSTLDGLLQLPGIGPKMAYLVLQEAWNKNEGIGVDTHVHRITNRLGWVKTKNPEQTRKELEDWLPREYWRDVNVMLVGFGQVLCKPVSPRCSDCPVAQLCPKVGTKKK